MILERFMGLFKKEKENLIITVDILTKKKYNHTWQKEHIGNILNSFYSSFFDEGGIAYFKEKDYFTGFEIVLEGSKFKLNKIDDINNWKQFIHRYFEFLPFFLNYMEKILTNLKLKFKLHRVQHFSSSLEEWMRALAMDKVKELENKGRVDPLNIHILEGKKKK
ncbi:MAG: hypothetical protein Q8P79_01400 [Nanoarchaeota archaeon]|nr:hypothetical protein [Nanoarchaeota archaeon]